MTRQDFLRLAGTAAVAPGAIAQSAVSDPALVPRPKQIQFGPGMIGRQGRATIRTVVGDPQAPGDSSEAYRLVATADGITITSRTDEGLQLGGRTAAQLLAGPAPLCEIVDWPDSSLRAAHLCYHLVRETLAYHCPNFQSLLEQIDQLAELKYNAVLLELESMIPYRRHPAIPCRLAFTQTQMAAIRDRLSAHRMQVIPLVQCLGHAYNVLIHSEYAGYRETPDAFQQFCPLNPKLPSLYMEFVDEYLERFPGIRQWHMGGDESRQLGRCPQCKAKVSKLGVSRLYVDHIAEIARRLHERGLTPLLWSDMLERHPEALGNLPGYLKIVYWNYDLPNWPRPYAAGAFRDRGFSVIGSAAVRFGSTGTELAVYYPEAMRGIETLIPKMKGEGFTEFIVTNWTKGSPHENTHYGFAYAADLTWNSSASRVDFQRRYAARSFGLPDGELCKVYDLLSLPLPYAEPVQQHMPDRLNRFDLSGLRFPAKWRTYTQPDREPIVVQQLENGLAAAAKAEEMLNRLTPQATRGTRQLELLRLSAHCIQVKARLGLALHRGRQLESGSRDIGALSAWRVEQQAILPAWYAAKIRYHDSLLPAGFPPSIDVLSELMFEPAEAEALETMGQRLGG